MEGGTKTGGAEPAYSYSAEDGFTIVTFTLGANSASLYYPEEAAGGVEDMDPETDGFTDFRSGRRVDTVEWFIDMALRLVSEGIGDHLRVNGHRVRLAAGGPTGPAPVDPRGELFLIEVEATLECILNRE